MCSPGHSSGLKERVIAFLCGTEPMFGAGGKAVRPRALSQGHWARLWPARGRGLGSDPPGTCHAEDLGFPPGESPKFNYLKASHLWLLRTAQTSWPVFVGYKSEHLLTNHHHSGFERIPFPRSLLNPDQGRVRLPLPLAGTTFQEVPRAWQQPRSQWREALRWITGDALP